MSERDDTGPSEPRGLSAELDRALEDVSDAAIADTAFLVGLSGKRAGKLFRIRMGDNIIGRSSKAFLTLDEKAVSHQHARLHLGPQGCFVNDMNSTNGTYVNDIKISSPTPLHAGDVMRIGNSTLGFLTDADDDEQHTRALARVTSAHSSMGPAAPGLSQDQLVVAPTGAHVVSPVVAHEVTTAAPEPEQNALDNILDKIALALGLLKVYWKLLVLCGAILGTVGGATAALSPPRAIARFEIFLRHDGSENPTRLFATRGIDFFVSAEKNFKNRDIVKKTMEEMSMSVGGNAVDGTAAGLSFEKNGLNTYMGSYAHPDASFAESFLAKHLQNYLEHEIGKAIAVLQSEVELLQNQFDQNEKNLREKEARLRDFKLENLDALPDTARDRISSRVSLMAQRDSLEAALERYSRELTLAKKQLSSEDAIVETRVERSQPYEIALAEVRKKLATARAQGFADGHPDIIKYKSEEQELLDLKRRTVETATTETDRRANPEHKRLANRVGELEVSVAATSTELGLVSSRLGEISKIEGDLPKVEADYAELERQAKSEQALHGRLYEQLKAKQLQLDFERASVAARYEVVDPPKAWPVSQVRTAAMRAGAGGVAGIVLGALIAALHWLIVYARNRRKDSASDETALARVD